MYERILVSRKRACELVSGSPGGLRMLVSRGRLVEGDALIGDAVRKGVTLASLATYYGWSPSTCDAILESHGINPDSEGYHFLAARDEASIEAVKD